MVHLRSTSSKGGRKRRHKKHRRTYKKNKPKSFSLVAYGKIYADWCGYCVALKPDWEKVERALLPMRSNNFESATKDTMIDRFNDRYKTDLQKEVGFPTIFKLTKIGGKIETYEGDRNANDIIAWLNTKTKANPESIKKENIFKWF
jgi:thiol-disulfide isomerase/thioredoxin